MTDPALEAPPVVDDFPLETGNMLEEVLEGLQKRHKQLPCKLFYDERGSELFSQICELQEYYPTRSEVDIMTRNVEEIVSLLGPGCLLIEYGSGTSEKSSILLENLPQLAGYVPIDISREPLMAHASQMGEAYPHLDIFPINADYNRPFPIPRTRKPVKKRVVYFPGSTIGNFHPPEAVEFLDRILRVCGSDGVLLVGVDLKKDPQILNLAYNDPGGITAEFNLNVLRRLNRELGADFDLDQFRHLAFYNDDEGRMEMHLESLRDQVVHLDGVNITFEKGERIWTESSYKYTLERFEMLALDAGFAVQKVWTDGQDLFSVQFLTPRSSGQG